jgi:cell wall-associated NlpC family hydrolase
MRFRLQRQETIIMRSVRKLLLVLAAVVGFGLVAGPAHAGVTGPAAEQAQVVAQVDDSDIATADAFDDEASPEGVEEPSAKAFTAAKVRYGGTITRATVLKRAKFWYDKNVPYSQSAYAWDVNHGKKFRTDCSGFVSMSWALTSSRTTRTLGAVSTKIAWKSLKPGDIVLRAGHHVQLFEKWANKSHTVFWIYEEGSTRSDMNHYKVSVSKSKSSGFVPRRYKKIK